MKKSFKLLDVLGFTTGVCCTPDFQGVMDVYAFMVKAKKVSFFSMQMMSDETFASVKASIYAQHPELANIGDPPDHTATNAEFEAWCTAQVDMFGEKIKLSRP